jgi:DNA-directed RNA polymerase specialized sigma24 family protein
MRELIEANYLNLQKLTHYIVTSEEEELPLDILHDAICTALVSKYEEQGKFMSWMGKIIQNTYRNFLNKASTKNEFNSEETTYTSKAPKYGIDDVWVEATIKKCKNIQKQRIMWLYLNGHHLDDIATRCEVSYNVVKNTVGRLRTLLKEDLEIDNG